MRTDEELKQLARDIVGGLVFHSGMILNPNDIASSFMILWFMKKEDWPFPPEEVGLIYEYYSEASPRSCNGYPIFFSCNVLNKENTDKLQGYVTRIRKATEEALKILD